LKSCAMIFVFIWVRASFPRIRFDQLMTFCWLVLLPCVLYGFEIIPTNLGLL
jgi:NADH-ubiquinone oxidoreductase chain 1